MKSISEIISTDTVCDVTAGTKDEVLVELCDIAANTRELVDHKEFLKAIMNREKIMSTGIGDGVAIPHARTTSVKDFVIAVGRSKKGIDFESLDDLPVHIIILMGSPERKKNEFLKILEQIGKLLHEPHFKQKFLDATSADEMSMILLENLK
ncbi:PTS sugar transporter subunit IIA [Candidatus Latescibacterota bacterium]